ncbi:MAG: hypothetical protein ACKVX7_07750 [Planctomycetota bacterium]
MIMVAPVLGHRHRRWLIALAGVWLAGVLCDPPRLLRAEWTFVRGDANGDGVVQISDGIYSLNYLFAAGPGECLDALDANDDGAVQISDPIYVLEYLFSAGPLPLAPFPACGGDPTLDAIGCTGPLVGCPDASPPPDIISTPITLAYVDALYLYDVEISRPLTSAVFSLPVAPLGATIAPSTGLVTWLPSALDVGSQAFAVRATVPGGSFTEQSFNVVVNPWPTPPVLGPYASPTGGLTVFLEGTAPGASQVEFINEAETETIALAPGVVAFSHAVTLESNSVNLIHVRSLNAIGQASAPVTAIVIHDAQPPNLHFDLPVAGSTVYADAIDVTGRVSDMLSGFVGLVVYVLVNGVYYPALVEEGIGTNGTFFVGPVPLELGINTITASAQDAVGNMTTVQTTVTRIAFDTALPTLTVVSGNGQTAAVGAELADPIVVRVLKFDGSPFANKLVTMRVTRSDGRLRLPGAPAASAAMLLQDFTDAQGEVAALWRLGVDAGSGNNRVEVTSRDIQGTINFCASAAAGAPVQLNLAAGDNQRGEIGAPASERLCVWVSDGNNGIAGVPTTFTVLRGTGLLRNPQSPSQPPAQTIVVPTDATGHAEAAFSFGAEPGNNTVSANTPTNVGAPAVFTLRGVARSVGAPTSFTGIVLSNAGQPIQSAICSIWVPGITIPNVAISGADGCFTFPAVSGAGPVDLYVDGITATAVGGIAVPTGSFPLLHFEPVLVPEAENSLPMPVLLPQLNPQNWRTYSTTQNTELTVEEISGLRMIVTAGSMRLPSGAPAPDGTPIALNIVHHDDVPMPIPDGAAPPFAWTLQPGGSTFDPPITIEYPNMSGLAPGAISNFLTFSHDTGKFEIFATGTVSADGAIVRSDPGVGLTLAGWGCNCPPYSVTGECENCETTCFSNGSLVGGIVQVNDPMPPYGSTLIFTASGVSDTGGIKEIECEGEPPEFESISPASPTYGWVITKPTGTTLTGGGGSASVLIDECGTYECVFTVTASRSCPPAPKTLTATALVDATLDMPVTLPSVTIDLSAFATLQEIFEMAAGASGICDVEGPDDATFSVGVETTQQCCPAPGGGISIEMLDEWTFSVEVSLGSLECNIPVLGVPYVASLNIYIAESLAVAAAGIIKETCEGTDLCFEPTITATVAGGVSGTVGPGGVVGSLVVALQNSVTVSGEYCRDAGSSAEINLTIEVIGTVELLSFITSSVSFELFEGSQVIP